MTDIIGVPDLLSSEVGGEQEWSDLGLSRFRWQIWPQVRRYFPFRWRIKSDLWGPYGMVTHLDSVAGAGKAEWLELADTPKGVRSLVPKG